MSVEIREKRRVVQVVAAKEVSGQPVIITLCDDGTMWAARPPAAVVYGKWERLEDVPQPEKCGSCEGGWVQPTAHTKGHLCEVCDGSGRVAGT